MALTPYVPSYWTGSGLANALNPNASFSAYTSTPAAPDRWSVFAGATPTRQVTGQVSTFASRVVGGAAAAAGIDVRSTSWTFAGAGWYMLEAIVTLVSGALTGSGIVLLTYTDTTFGSLVETITLALAVDADVNGVVQGVGVAATTYRYRKLIQVAKQTSLAADLTANSHHATLGSIAGANSLDWSQASIRPATPAEIAAGNQVQSYPVFPILPGLTPEQTKSPTWSTGVLRASSGRTRRTAQWSYPIWKWDLKIEVARHRPTNDELFGLWEMFNTVQGQAASFLFLDQSDFTEIAAPIGTGDGVTTVFQMQRSMRAWNEPVFAPFGITVYDNGVATAAYTLGNLGLITFNSAPTAGHTLTWDGYFFFIAAFSQDDLPFDQMLAQLWSQKGLKIESVKQ